MTVLLLLFASLSVCLALIIPVLYRELKSEHYSLNLLCSFYSRGKNSSLLITVMEKIVSNQVSSLLCKRWQQAAVTSGQTKAGSDATYFTLWTDKTVYHDNYKI